MALFETHFQSDSLLELCVVSWVPLLTFYVFLFYLDDLLQAFCYFLGASSDLPGFFFQSDFLLGLTISSETVCAFFVVRLLVGLCVVI